MIDRYCCLLYVYANACYIMIIASSLLWLHAVQSINYTLISLISHAILITTLWSWLHKINLRKRHINFMSTMHTECSHHVKGKWGSVQKYILLMCRRKCHILYVYVCNNSVTTARTCIKYGCYTKAVRSPGGRCGVMWPFCNWVAVLRHGDGSIYGTGSLGMW